MAEKHDKWGFNKELEKLEQTKENKKNELKEYEEKDLGLRNKASELIDKM